MFKVNDASPEPHYRQVYHIPKLSSLTSSWASLHIALITGISSSCHRSHSAPPLMSLTKVTTSHSQAFTSDIISSRYSSSHITPPLVSLTTHRSIAWQLSSWRSLSCAATHSSWASTYTASSHHWHHYLKEFINIHGLTGCCTKTRSPWQWHPTQFQESKIESRSLHPWLIWLLLWIGCTSGFKYCNGWAAVLRDLKL